MAQHSTIVILDFGAQYTQLIARRVRELNVYCVILPCTAAWEKIQACAPHAIILSGGPASVYDAGAPKAAPEIFQAGVPVLGICYGLQYMAQQFGGVVRGAGQREYGRARMEILEAEPLFTGLPAEQSVWMSHGDSVEKLPEGFRVLARSGEVVAAIAHPGARMWAVQFHPEVRHTEHGRQILANFLFNICKLRPDWTPDAFVGEQIERIRATVGPSGRALCALSGGVDSSVAAMLVHRAIGDRLTCVFVNNGLLRLREFEKVQQNLRQRLGLNLIGVDSEERFLRRLEGVSDPEQKRKIIGAEFIAVFEEEARKLAGAASAPEFLVQGTLYPDVIESVSVHGPSAVIKSHHNVGGLPEKMGFQLLEPLRLLFKDEVRRIGLELGIAEELIWRQPFPGPGLAVRILGPVDREKIELLQRADDIAGEEIKRAGLYRSLWQSFMVLLPVRSVGVMGDFRTYGYTAVLRAVQSEDGMTADWARLPHELLEVISNRVINEVPGINRVAYDISSKPPATIEWE